MGDYGQNGKMAGRKGYCLNTKFYKTGSLGFAIRMGMCTYDDRDYTENLAYRLSKASVHMFIAVGKNTDSDPLYEQKYIFSFQTA